MSTVEELTIEERVAAGAAWLDEHHPGWMDRIFLESLDVSSCTLCVLGQVFGNYRDAPEAAKYIAGAFPIEDDDFNLPARLRGFERKGGMDFEYAELTAEWRRLIESRRVAS